MTIINLSCVKSRSFFLFLCIFFLSFWLFTRFFNDKSYIIVTNAGLSWINGMYVPCIDKDGFSWTKMDAKKQYFPDIFEIAQKQPQETKLSKAFVGRSKKFWFIAQPAPGRNERPVGLYLNEGVQNRLYPPRRGWEASGGQQKLLPAPTVEPGGKIVNDENSGKEKGWQGKNVRDLISTPATVILLAVNLFIAYRLWDRRTPVDRVSFSLAAFLDGEYWRVFSASFAHFDIMHLGFNMMSLYNLRGVEKLLGTFAYTYLSLDMVVCTMLLNAAAYYYMWKSTGLERHRVQQSVGYSCVLFGWMVVAAVRMEEFCPIPGFTSLCFKTYSLGPVAFNAGPLLVLVLTSFIMPRASFIGHLSGIVFGFFVAWGILRWLVSPLLVAICIILILIHQHGWPSKLPDFSYFISSEAQEALTEADCRMVLGLKFFLIGQLLIAVLQFFLFSWRVVVPQIFLAVLSYPTLQAFKVGRHPDAESEHHRICALYLLLLALMAITQSLFQLLSLPAILGNWVYLLHSYDVQTAGLFSRVSKLGIVCLLNLYCGWLYCLEASKFSLGQTCLKRIGLYNVMKTSENFTLEPTVAFEGTGNFLGSRNANQTRNMNGNSFRL